MTNPAEQPVPGSAAATATSLALDFFNQNYDQATPPPAPPAVPAPAAPPAPPASAVPKAVPEDIPPPPSVLPPATPAPASPAPATPAPATPTPPPPAPDLSGIPDHVVRSGAESINTWKDLKSRLRVAEQKVVDMERERALKATEDEELKKKLENAPSQEAIDKANARIEELEDEVGRMDVSRSRRFREMYDKPLEDCFGKVVTQFVRAGHTKEDAVSLARQVFRPGMSDPQTLLRALDDEDQLTIGAVSTFLQERDVLAQKREEALTHWREEKAAEDAERATRERAEMSSALRNSVERAFERATSDGSWLFKTGEDELWNKGVEARKNAVRAYVREGKPDDLTLLIAEGVAAPVYRRMLEKAHAENQELRGQLERFAGVRPSVGSGGGAPPPAQPAQRAATLDGFLQENASAFNMLGR